MSARPVQISMEEELLERIDADPEVRERGRSAFIRSAVELYLAVRARRRTEEQIARAYGSRVSELAEEAAELMDVQAWPDE